MTLRTHEIACLTVRAARQILVLRNATRLAFSASLTGCKSAGRTRRAAVRTSCELELPCATGTASACTRKPTSSVVLSCRTREIASRAGRLARRCRIRIWWAMNATMRAMSRLETTGFAKLARHLASSILEATCGTILALTMSNLVLKLACGACSALGSICSRAVRAGSARTALAVARAGWCLGLVLTWLAVCQGLTFAITRAGRRLALE